MGGGDGDVMEEELLAVTARAAATAVTAAAVAATATAEAAKIVVCPC